MIKKDTKPIIAKFGGTSVSTRENIQTICDIVRLEKNLHPILVVSALSKVTDLLSSLEGQLASTRRKTLEEIHQKHRTLIKNIWHDAKAEEIFSYIDLQLKNIEKLFTTRNLSKSMQDTLISHGEIMSSYIITAALQKCGIDAKQIIASEIIITDKHHGSAEFLVEPTKKKVTAKLLPLIQKGIVPVVTGFIGATQQGKTTTLGRGGSDYSASIIGYCMHASEVQIWTDVDGMYTVDPRMVKNAKLLKNVSYREASEMAFFGAKVLHPRTIRPAVKAKIPLRVLNTFRPKEPGTFIKETVERLYPISAITFKRNATLVNIYSTAMLLTKGFLVGIFSIFAKHNISINLVSVSEVSISVTLDNDDALGKVIDELKMFTKVTVARDLSIISIIGEGITNSSKITKTIFDVLDKRNIVVKMISLGATNINISLVVETQRLEDAVRILHNTLIEGK